VTTTGARLWIGVVCFLVVGCGRAGLPSSDQDAAAPAEGGPPVTDGGTDADGTVEDGGQVDVLQADALQSDAQTDVEVDPALSMDHQPWYDFGDVVVGTTSASVELTVKNVGGRPTGPIGGAWLSGGGATAFVITADGCAGRQLAATESCIVQVALGTATAGIYSAVVSVSASPGGLASTTLKGRALTPSSLSIAPSAGDFGSRVVDGETFDVVFTVTNTGGATSGSVSLALGGSDAGQFAFVAGGTCDAAPALAGGQSCKTTVRFAPTTVGSKAASLTADASPGGPAVAALSGEGFTPAALSFTSFAAFGVVPVGSDATVRLTLVNGGSHATGDLGIPTAGSPFSVMATTCAIGGPLGPGGTCTIDVRFQPGTWGAVDGQLAISASPGGTATAGLSGTGQQTLTLAVATAGTGTGTITDVPPAGIACGTGGADCDQQYVVTTAAPTVTLKATADDGFILGAWAGCTPEADPTRCTAEMSADRSVTATFAIRPPETWITAAPPSHAGRVVSFSFASDRAPVTFQCQWDTAAWAPCIAPSRYTFTTTATRTFRVKALYAGVEDPTPASRVVAIDAAAAGLFPDSSTTYCTDGSMSIACPSSGPAAGQDGNYQIDVPVYAVMGTPPNEFVEDPVTGLWWQRSVLSAAPWATQMAACAGSTLYGWSWRLPTRFELLTILDDGRVYPALNAAAFPAPASGSLWSADLDDSTGNAWHLEIGTGRPLWNDIGAALPARCVTGTYSTHSAANYFLSASGATVNDTSTGRVWQGSSSGATYVWTDALAYCNALDLDGFTDWRAPTAKELASLADVSSGNNPPEIPPVFPGRSDAEMWTSSPYPGDPTRARTVWMVSGGVWVDKLTSTHLEVRCVRGP
jgi:hypothetical protein